MSKCRQRGGGEGGGVGGSRGGSRGAGVVRGVGGGGRDGESGEVEVRDEQVPSARLGASLWEITLSAALLVLRFFISAVLCFLACCPLYSSHPPALSLSFSPLPLVSPFRLYFSFSLGLVPLLYYPCLYCVSTQNPTKPPNHPNANLPTTLSRSHEHRTPRTNTHHQTPKNQTLTSRTHNPAIIHKHQPLSGRCREGVC